MLDPMTYPLTPSRHAGTEWTPALIARLLDLWNSGHTSTQIAPLMGISRSAVMGKIKRLEDAGYTVRKHNGRATAEVDAATKAPQGGTGPDANG